MFWDVSDSDDDYAPPQKTRFPALIIILIGMSHVFGLGYRKKRYMIVKNSALSSPVDNLWPYLDSECSR